MDIQYQDKAQESKQKDGRADPVGAEHVLAHTPASSQEHFKEIPLGGLPECIELFDWDKARKFYAPLLA